MEVVEPSNDVLSRALRPQFWVAPWAATSDMFAAEKECWARRMRAYYSHKDGYASVRNYWLFLSSDILCESWKPWPR